LALIVCGCKYLPIAVVAELVTVKTTLDKGPSLIPRTQGRAGEGKPEGTGAHPLCGPFPPSLPSQFLRSLVAEDAAKRSRDFPDAQAVINLCYHTVP
jgi:hypothetical protein